MGKRGPTPKRSTQRRRTNDPVVPVTKAEGAAKVVVPAVDPGWHPVAARLFESLRGSGQSAFYEPSDWAAAVLLCESISRELHPQPTVVGSGKDAQVEMLSLPPKGASMSAWQRTMTALLVTEGDRRRVSLELQRASSGAGEEVGGVSELDEYRRRIRNSAG
jgi:hypothetical protein